MRLKYNGRVAFNGGLAFFVCKPTDKPMGIIMLKKDILP
jgi:hypothetical protein